MHIINSMNIVTEEVMEYLKRMFTWISKFSYKYTVDEQVRLHVHFGDIRCHVLLLDGPQMPLITIDAHATYHFPFERTP